MNPIALAVTVAAIVAGAVFGMAVTDGAWQRDCGRLGAHVVDGKVYDCKPRSEAIPVAIHRP